MNDNITKIGGAILIGGLVGAAIGLLYAPKSGQRTRRDIIRTARKVKNSATDLIEDTIDDVHDIIKDLRGKASDVVDQGTGLTDRAKKEIIATLEQGQKTIEKQKQKFTEALGRS
ncbi:MAG: YtxH domain-containing protein [Syntrophaceae bacterium]|nr:YtxH domain-containing protein [Syntrophaceae bacterium]